MLTTRKEVFFFFAFSLLGYFGACSYFIKQAPVIQPAPFNVCVNSCTATIEYPVSSVSEQYVFKGTVKSVFEKYRQEDVGYYLSCFEQYCALSVYVNTPSQLAPLLQAVNKQFSPLIKDDAGEPQHWLDSTIYLLFSRTLSAIHHLT
jgi:hypothetical protein